MKKLLSVLGVRMMMEQAGEPASTGGAAGNNAAADGQENGAETDMDGNVSVGDGSGKTKPQAGKEKPANLAGADGGKKSLLGGAKSGEGEQTPEGEPSGNKTDAPAQDPYADLKPADGVSVDGQVLADYKKLAAEISLSAQGAQRLLDFEAQRLQAAAKQAADEWKEQTQQQYGDNLPRALATAARAVQTFGGDELRELLDQTGLGNHPVLIEAFRKAGAALQEDKSVPSNSATTGDKTFMQALYGQHSK